MQQIVDSISAAGLRYRGHHPYSPVAHSESVTQLASDCIHHQETNKEPITLEHLDRQVIACTIVRAPRKSQMKPEALMHDLSLYRSTKSVSQCLDGTKPFARLLLYTIFPWVSIRNDAERNTLTVQVYETPEYINGQRQNKPVTDEDLKQLEHTIRHFVSSLYGRTHYVDLERLDEEASQSVIFSNLVSADCTLKDRTRDTMI